MVKGEEKHLRVLIVGLGSIGQRHVRNLRRLLPLKVIAYRVRRWPLPEDLQGDWLIECDSLEESFAYHPHAALICNPTSLHLKTALAAAKAGCHLFIEKPISNNLVGLDKLQEEIQCQKRKVVVGFQFHFHPGLQIIKQLLDKKIIGRVVYITSHWGEYLPGWHPLEDYQRGYSARSDLGGGVILTLCHPFDYLRWLVGEVSSVTAMAGHLSNLEIDVEDTANVLLQFEDGLLGSVHLDFVQSPVSHYLEIVCEEGTIRWDNNDGAVWILRRGQKAEVFSAPKEFERNQIFLNEMKHFLDCVAGEAEPFVTLEDGIQALAIALAAKRSTEEKRTIEVKDVWAT